MILQREENKMKKAAIILCVSLLVALASCDKTREIPDFQAPDEVVNYLKEGNDIYVSSEKNGGDVSASVRKDTAENGQKPYAVVVTCSDSRVPAEHIFYAGIGELFVIRTAGNVIGDYETGSVEYGAEHLHTKLVLVLGHTQCGAVEAALSGGAHGHIKDITDEINACVPAGTDARAAEILNVRNSMAEIMESHVMQELVRTGAVEVRGAIYHIETGRVEFLPKE